MAEVLLSSWPVLAGIAALLAVSAFFSSAETAVFCVGPGDLRALRQAGRRGVGNLERLVAGRRTLLVTILLGNLTVNVAAFNLAALLSTRFAGAGAVGAAAATPVLLLLAVVVAGEIVPKVVAVHEAPRIALAAAAPLIWIERALFLPRVVLSAVANALVRLLVGERKEEGELTDEELEQLLSLSAAEGHLAADEGAWLQAVLDLSATEVGQIMVPRTDMVAFHLEEGRDAFLDLVARRRRNKIPVHLGSLDEIDSYLDVRDVLAKPDAPLEALRRPVVFVPENARISHAAETVIDRGARLLIVVDEYGGTAGLLTKEDLVEAVIGDLSDEADADEPMVVHEGPGHFEVDAGLDVRSWGRLVGRRVGQLPVSTVGGLVSFLLGRIPRVGDEVASGRLRFRVKSVRRRAPHRIEVWSAPRGERRP